MTGSVGESLQKCPDRLKHFADFVLEYLEILNFLLKKCVSCFILELQICYQLP